MLVESRWKVHPGMPMEKDRTGIGLREATLKSVFKKSFRGNRTDSSHAQVPKSSLEMYSQIHLYF